MRWIHPALSLLPACPHSTIINPSAPLFPVYLPPRPFAATLTQAKDAVVNTATEAANKASEAAKSAANTASETATKVRWGQAQSLINEVWG